MLKWMVAEGYGDARTLQRRVARMEQFLENPELLEADKNAEYAEVIEIDLNEIKEPILCAPNDPDDARTLSEVCLLYTSPSPRDQRGSRMPSSA